MDKTLYYFWVFLTYSLIGFLLETAFSFFWEHRLRNRKLMLFLPICPVYGLGVVALLVLLRPFEGNAAVIFIGGALVASAVEFLYSLVVERIFNVMVWDYGKLKWSVNGRVNLLFSLFWGGLAVGLFHYIHPAVEPVINMLPGDLALPAAAILVIDSAMTGIVYYRYGKGDGDPTGFDTLSRRA